MRPSFFILPMMLASGLACGPQARIDESRQLGKAPLYTFNETEVDAYLRNLAEAPSPMVERVATIARKNIGQPYRLYLLGEFPYELHDADPLYCLSASDCVTFVEYTYAMALSWDWPSFFRTLQRIRYKGGKIGILTRNHFTEADWNINNAWLFEDITDYVASAGARKMAATIDRAAFFRKFGLDEDIPVEHFRSTYIAKAILPEILDRLQIGDVIEIVRGSDTSQYVGHMGLVMHDSEGRAMLIHSSKPAVREEPLLEYIARHENILGIKVLRAFRRWDAR